MKKAIALVFPCVLLCACNANTPSSGNESNNSLDATASQGSPQAPVVPCQGNTFNLGEYALTITPSRNGDVLDAAVSIRNIADYPVNWFRAIPPPLLMHAFKLVDGSGKSYAVSGLGELDPIHIEDKVIEPKASLSGTISFNVPAGDYDLQVQQILGSDKNMTTSTILQCGAETSQQAL